MSEQHTQAPLLELIHRSQCLEYNTISCSGAKISDELSQEIEKWNLYPILINAPTGSGKSSFVFTELAKYAAQTGQYVLVLSNRLALNLQQKSYLCKLYDLPNYGSKALADVKYFRNIILLTYQSILHELMNGSFSALRIKYIVFDEAHFFCSDAIFNPWTESILVSLQRCFPTATRIYMSATPENAKPIISAFEKYALDLLEQESTTNPNTQYANHLKVALLLSQPKVFTEYKFQTNFQNISLAFFYEWDYVLDRIKESSKLSEASPKQDKWLIFISEKDVGRQLKRDLGSNIADYIDANSPSNYIAELTRRQLFDKKVLISTSVIDNGISIQDGNLKNIVIDTIDRIQLIQMLGRKRIDSNEEITLYVKLPSSVKAIQNYRQVAENLYSTIASYERNPTHFMYSNWGSLTTGQQNLFAPHIKDQGLFLGANTFAKYQLAVKCHEFEQLEDQLKMDEFAFAKQVCSWLQKDFSTDMVLENTPTTEIREQLISILNTQLGIPIPAEGEIKELANELKNKLPLNEIKKFKFKNDNANRGAEDIRKILKEYDLPFILSTKKNGHYHLQPKGEA